MNTIKLNNDWKLTCESLSRDISMAQAVLDKKDGWMDCVIPCDIHMPLIDNGIIKDPVLSTNSYDCEWTEEKSWWFMKTFTLDAAMLENDVIELTWNPWMLRPTSCSTGVILRVTKAPSILF